MDTLPRIALTGVQKEAEHCSSKIVQVKSPSNHFEGYFVENILRKKMASLFPHIMQIKTKFISSNEANMQNLLN